MKFGKGTTKTVFTIPIISHISSRNEENFCQNFLTCFLTTNADLLKGLRQRLDWKWYIHLSAAFTFWQGHCLILWDGYGYDKWPNHHMKIYHKKGTVLCVHQGLILRVEFMTCKKKFLVLLQKFFCGINMDFGLFLSPTRISKFPSLSQISNPKV